MRLADAGRLDLQQASVPVRELVETVAGAFSSQAYKQGIDIDVCVAPDVPAQVIGDATRLRQILANLVANAVKFTEQGGVSIDVALEAPGRLRVLVSDTGCGIQKENVGRIFEPFFTTKPVGVGTGLGLAICKQIVSDLGGDLTVESEPDRGTTFQVLLPARVHAHDSHRPMGDARAALRTG